MFLCVYVCIRAFVCELHICTQKKRNIVLWSFSIWHARCLLIGVFVYAHYNMQSFVECIRKTIVLTLSFHLDSEDLRFFASFSTNIWSPQNFVLCMCVVLQHLFSQRRFVCIVERLHRELFWVVLIIDQSTQYHECHTTEVAHATA